MRVVRYNDRSADQRGLVNHLGEQFIARELVQNILTLLVGTRPSREEVSRLRTNPIEQPAQLVRGQTLAEVIPSLVRDARLSEELLSLPATRSGRVNENRRHRLFLPFQGTR